MTRLMVVLLRVFASTRRIRFRSAIAICASLVVGTSLGAEVGTVSSDKLEQIDGEGFWQAEVSCEGVNETVDIQQAIKSQEWCVAGGLVPCASTKMAMAQAVCGNVELFVRNQAQPVSNTQPSRSTPPAQSSAVQARRQAAEREAIARQAAVREQQRQAALAADLQRQSLRLQEERANLEREKLALEQEEVRLEARAREVETLLEGLE